ncbi:MAG: hypothetical protein Q7J78_05395, partial [Clostridiales bacterium]|nr:hypothetical protein [Clostridiales bacterium]
QYSSKAVIFGAGMAGQARQSFVQYLEKYGPRRRELINIYNCYGIHDMSGIHEPTYMTEELIMSNLDDLEAFREKDIQFDYYYFDSGWNNPNGDLKDFDPKYWPNGAAKAFERIHGMGMKVGLWTSPASGPAAFYPEVKVPRLSSCGSLPRRESGNAEAYRGMLCIAADPWRSEYLEALCYHVKENHVRGFKFDGNMFICTNPEHNHLPGKYSMEPIMDATIEVLEAVRLECPEIMYMFYWNIQSPLWLLYGDTIYERGILMEGSTPADFPTRLLRQSITVSYDQAAHHAWDHVPLSSGDSLGVWISKWRWANYIGREGWQDAWVMDIARGSLLHQLWGDLSMFEAEDIEFLSYISTWVKDNSYLLQYPQRILGDPWKAEPYGYGYFEGDNGAVFVFNPTFEDQTVELQLGPEIGLSAEFNQQTYEISSIYTAEQAVYRPGQYFLKGGDKFAILLKPHEVKVLEICPGEGLSLIEGTSKEVADKEAVAASGILAVPFAETLREDISWEDPHYQWVIRRMINGRAQYVDTDEAFKEVKSRSDERDRWVTRRIVKGNVTIAPLIEPRTILIGASLTRAGIYWHHHALFDIIKLKGTLNEKELAFQSTPHRWHEEAGGWSWILFELLLDSESSARNVTLEIEAYLPKSVDLKLDVWLYKD